MENIQAEVVKVLKEVQTLCGRDWTGLPASSKPLLHLEGFDSLCSVEATAIVEDRLGFRLEKAVSIFMSEDGQDALSLLEISQRIKKLLP